MQFLIHPVLDRQETRQIIQTLFRSSGHFLDHPDIFFRLSRHFSDHQDTFSRLLGYFLDHQETFQIIGTHFLDHLDTFQIVQILSRSSRHFLDYPDTFQIIKTLCNIIWIFCIASGRFPNYLEILQPIMSMPQKLSGLAKTFRPALLTR